MGLYSPETWVDDIDSSHLARWGFAFGIFKSSLMGVRSNKLACMEGPVRYEVLIAVAKSFIRLHPDRMIAMGVKQANDAITLALMSEYPCPEEKKRSRR